MSRLSCILSVLFLNTVGAALGGCATTLASRAPRDVDLSGEWQIDLALSDFPQEAVPIQPAGGEVADAAGGRGGGRRGGRGGGLFGGMPQGGPGGNSRGDLPEHHFAMPPHLSISQSATGLSVNITMQDGKHLLNRYLAGVASVVTTTRGPANRTLGWDGDSFLIRTRVGDKGPRSDVRYSLDRDGTLSVTSTITNSGIYDFQYTLEYDRVTP